MTGINIKSFDTPDETRAPDKTKVETVSLGGHKAARLTFQPGWRWSECIKPVVGGDLCQALHFGTLVAGQMHIVHSDGTELDVAAGDAYVIEPGHDAWVLGDGAAVAYEFESASAESYASPKSRRSGV
ncbi:MAG: cupin domain-containing protein [Actinomycetota bacterium]|nr:cupin domain-containing protein [Actinomycetota bacterium]